MCIRDRMGVRGTSTRWWVMSRGNAYPDTRISVAEQAALRPEVARLAGLGRTYAQIAQALSTSLCPLNGRKVRAIQVRFGIPAGGPNGRPRGVPDRAGDASGNAARIAAAAAARAKVRPIVEAWTACLLYTSDAADER